MYNIQTIPGASDKLQAEGPRNGQNLISSGDVFMQMRAARTTGVFRGADLEAQNYGYVSKTINPKFESNLPSQLVICPVDVYPNALASQLTTAEQSALPFYDDIYELNRIEKAFDDIILKLDQLIERAKK